VQVQTSPRAAHIYTKRRPTLLTRTKGALWSYLLLLPAAALVLTFVILPLLASYPYTLYNWSGIGQPEQYVGLDNFVRVSADPYFWAAFRRTFTYAAFLVPIQLTLALILALVLNNPKLRGSSVYRAIFFSPVVTSQAVVGIVLTFLLNSFNGPLTQLGRGLGWLGKTDSISIIGDPRFTFAAIIAVGIWHSLGINLIYFLAALQSIPQELYEAARIDGASAQQEFWHITVPSLRAPGLIIVFLAVLGSLGVFELVVVMAGTGASGMLSNSEVVSTYIYRNAFTFSGGGNVGFASAAALFMGFITLLLSLVQLVVLRRFGVQRKGFEDSAGKPETRDPTKEARA